MKTFDEVDKLVHLVFLFLLTRIMVLWGFDVFQVNKSSVDHLDVDRFFSASLVSICVTALAHGCVEI